MIETIIVFGGSLMMLYVAVITKPVFRFSLHVNFSLHQNFLITPKNSPHSPTQPKYYFWARGFYEEKIFDEMKNFHGEKKKRILVLVMTATSNGVRCEMWDDGQMTSHIYHLSHISRVSSAMEIQFTTDHTKYKPEFRVEHDVM